MKRITGIKGYCDLHHMDIRQHKKSCYYPYVCCRDANNELIKDCDIQLKFTGREQ